MSHIHQKNSSGSSYTYVITNAADLSQDPSILEQPNQFEILAGDPPIDAQGLYYLPIATTDLVVSLNAAYTSTQSDLKPLGEASKTFECSGAWIFTLPSAVGVEGQELVIKNTNTSGVITVKAFAGEKIDNASTTQKNVGAGSSFTFRSDGSKFLMI